MNRFSPTLAAFALGFLLPGAAGHALAQSSPPTVTVTGQTAGPTPFIADIQLSTDSVSTLKSVAFEITPKAGSVTRPVSAVYFSDYLQNRGYLDRDSGQITVPIFGLYADRANTVTLTSRFADGSSQQSSVTVTTPAFADAYGYSTPTVLQARTADTTLSYDFLVLKNNLGTQAPVILDTDGEVRWVGTTGEAYYSVAFLDNSFFVAYAPAGSSVQTGVARLELDGTYSFLADYAGLGVNSTDQHNYDPGKLGFLASVNTVSDVQSVVVEIDTAGDLLRNWNLADIISAAMTAGGDDPTQFVDRENSNWFHNNANAYRKSDDTVLVSSRENFVIALDYQTGAIKWIFGDPTKKWYEFPSLRQYALTLADGSVPPIGQHAISITHDDDLLLFDNGAASAYQVPAGESLTYSSPRKYHLDTQAMTATEVWNYPAGESVYSPFTSSVYEDDPSNYLIDYANEYASGVPTYAELVGLDTAGAKVFDYRYPAATPAFGWNALPFHFENLVFTGPVTALAADHAKFFTGEISLNDGVYYLAFPGNDNVFGYYSYLSDPHYFYHFGLGYEYWFDANDSQHGLYLYDFASGGFFYTSPQFPFPYLYDFTLGTVLYYFYDPSTAGSGVPRYFYDFAVGEVITK